MQSAKAQEPLNLPNRCLPYLCVTALIVEGHAMLKQLIIQVSACCWLQEVMLQAVERRQPGMPGQQAGGGGWTNQPA